MRGAFDDLHRWPGGKSPEKGNAVRLQKNTFDNKTLTEFVQGCQTLLQSHILRDKYRMACHF